MSYASSIIPTVLPPLTISECIASDKANSILQLSNMEGNSVALVMAISEGRGLVVADGSYMAERSTKLGTAAWKLEDELTKVNCKGMVRTTGKEKDVNPYQSKLQGLHATVSCISVICQHHQVISGKVTVCCNNEKALWLSSIRTIQVPLCTKHADLMRVIHKTVADLPIKVVFQDVMGHQDKHGFYDDLNQPSQLNVQMDFEAK
jgi:hypothetical protein